MINKRKGRTLPFLFVCALCMFVVIYIFGLQSSALIHKPSQGVDVGVTAMSTRSLPVVTALPRTSGFAALTTLPPSSPIPSQPQPLGDYHLFVIWPDAYSVKSKILKDLQRSPFRILDVVEVAWREDQYLENLWRLYSGKGGEERQGMKLKVRQCGKGKFTVVLVEDSAPDYRDEQTAHGIDHVNHNVNERKNMYRKWAGGGFRVHGTFNKAEAEHDLFLLYGKSLPELATLYGGNTLSVTTHTRSSSETTFGFTGWSSCEQLTTALLYAGSGAELSGKCGSGTDNTSDEWSVTVHGTAGFNTLVGTVYHYTWIAPRALMKIQMQGDTFVTLRVKIR